MVAWAHCRLTCNLHAAKWIQSWFKFCGFRGKSLLNSIHWFSLDTFDFYLTLHSFDHSMHTQKTTFPQFKWDWTIFRSECKYFISTSGPYRLEWPSKKLQSTLLWKMWAIHIYFHGAPWNLYSINVYFNFDSKILYRPPLVIPKF